MGSIWDELKRRNVVKVAIAYAIVAWLLIQVAATILPVFVAPDWVVQVFTFFVILGFPLALILSWAYELTPEGIMKTRQVPLEKSISHMTGQTLNYVITGLLVVVVGFVVVDQYAGKDESALAVAPADSDRDAAAESIVSDASGELRPNWIAILPFDNMSVDPEDAFFAAGIHDEIINQIANISDLNVVARTSVMQYEGARKPVTEIARDLNVAYLLEGSVSYADQRVRIRAQLIDGDTGAHLWSDVFPAEILDVFEVYADLSSRIAESIEAELLPSERERIARAPTQSAAAYAFYLNALDMYGDWHRRVELLDRAIENDTDFALAYAAKAAILGNEFVSEVTKAATVSIERGAEVAAELEREVISQAESALALDPELGLAYSALGELHSRYWRREQAEAAFSRAVDLSPRDSEVLLRYSGFSTQSGDYEKAIDLARRAFAIDPGRQWSVNYLSDAATPYFMSGDFDTAAKIWQQNIATVPDSANSYLYLAEAEAARGNPEAAIDDLRIFEQLIGYDRQPAIARAAYVYSLCGRQDDVVRVLANSAQIDVPVSPIQRVFWALASKDADQSLKRLQEAVDYPLPSNGSAITVMVKNNVYGDPLLERPEFVELRKQLGFQD